MKTCLFPLFSFLLSDVRQWPLLKTSNGAIPMQDFECFRALPTCFIIPLLVPSVTTQHPGNAAIRATQVVFKERSHGAVDVFVGERNEKTRRLQLPMIQHHFINIVQIRLFSHTDVFRIATLSYRAKLYVAHICWTTQFLIHNNPLGASITLDYVYVAIILTTQLHICISYLMYPPCSWKKVLRVK